MQSLVCSVTAACRRLLNTFKFKLKLNLKGFVLVCLTADSYAKSGMLC